MPCNQQDVFQYIEKEEEAGDAKKLITRKSKLVREGRQYAEQEED